MPANTVPKHLNPRSVRTRHSLMEAGLKLFAERPVDAVPIDDIVAAANVAKGSFFNHFEDKQEFAEAISADIRMELEARVTEANKGLADPLERLVGGMRVAVNFALTEKERTTVMVQGVSLVTSRDHPLNAGLRSDIETACAAGLLRKEASTVGLLLWLGACHWIMANIVDRNLSRAKTADRMRDMMIVALIGLGVDESRATFLAKESETQLRASGT